LSCHVWLGACGAEDYGRRSDAIATAMLAETQAATLGDRYEVVRRPGPPAAETPGSEPPGETTANPPRLLSLDQALELAFRGNRAHQARREALLLQAISLAGVRHRFSPQVSLTLNYLFADVPGTPWTQGVGLGASVSQILPWGGSVSLGASSDYDQVNSDGTFSSAASITLTQPLLRGSGAAVTNEPLIQAERDLVYAIRSFELQREDFAIDTARRFYDLVQRKQTIRNLKQNLEGFVFGRRQAEALFQVGRTSELDALRARRSELTSMDALISAEEDNSVELDRFRIFLGLPREQPIDVLPEAPEFIETTFPLEEAVEVALANRLDYLTETERLEDTRRALKLSADPLRPDLTLTSSFGALGRASGNFTGQDVGRDSLTVGLDLSLPVDRVDEANNYRRAQISAAQAERDYEQFRDTLVLEIRSSFRELERRRQSLDIQEELIASQEKNVKIAQIRFEQGKVSNRDVTEAQEAMLEAKNRLISERVNYEISRLGLLRALGILFIDEQGMFRE